MFEPEGRYYTKSLALADEVSVGGLMRVVVYENLPHGARLVCACETKQLADRIALALLCLDALEVSDAVLPLT